MPASARLAPARPGSPDTAAHILQVAERLVQTRGFNGFSYADIAAEVGITKASLHYHFPSKAALGRRLIDRYAEVFTVALAEIDAGALSAPAKLERYAGLYANVLRGDRLCLCGMLAAEYSSLPPPMQEAVRAFFDLNESWLAKVAEGGRAAGTLRFEGDPGDLARLLLSSLEGAMLIARPYADLARFEASASRLLNELLPSPA